MEDKNKLVRIAQPPVKKKKIVIPTSKVLLEKFPSVLVVSIISNASKWVDRFFKCLINLDYPRDKLRYAFMEGGSSDNTWDKLVKFKDAHENVWLKQIDSDIEERFGKLAFLRNKLINETLKDEDYVFSVDSDVVDIPPETLKLLIKADVDIAAPYVFIEGSSQFYDVLAYIYKGKNFSPSYPYCYSDKNVETVKEVIELIRELKVKEGWLLTEDKIITEYIKKCGDLFEVDSVGTCYLVKRKVYDADVRYEGGRSEQVTFCFNARQKGFKVWVDSRLSILHADLKSYGENWH